MGLSACAEWILNFVQEIAGVSTDPQRSWSTKHILFLSFLVCEAKTGPPLKWYNKKNVLAMGLSACAEWILNFVQEIAVVSTDPQGSWSTKHILFLSFLVCESKTGPPYQINEEFVFAMGLSACAEWILNFVQDIAGVVSEPQGSCSTKHILFLEVSWSLKQRLYSLKFEWEEKIILAIGLSGTAKWILN